jgi:hypothetical protein
MPKLAFAKWTSNLAESTAFTRHFGVENVNQIWGLHPGSGSLKALDLVADNFSVKHPELSHNKGFKFR